MLVDVRNLLNQAGMRMIREMACAHIIREKVASIILFTPEPVIPQSLNDLRDQNDLVQPQVSVAERASFRQFEDYQLALFQDLKLTM